MKAIIIEIRASEGGNDSKLLVTGLADVYVRACKNNDFHWRVSNIRDGFTSIWIEGENVTKFFSNESGSHCFVRIPPTEKNGRVQTSFVSVALMNPDDQVSFKLDPNSINKQYTRSRGKGGQNVNKVSSCVQLTHVPTGIQVRCEDTRDQGKNETLAYERLAEKLKSIAEREHLLRIQDRRNSQIGDGSRGARKRTYRINDGIVIDHSTGKQCRWKDVQKGRIDLLK